MNILKIEQTEWLSEAKKYIMAGEHCIFHTIISKPVVLVYNKSQIDSDTCEDMGYDVYEAYFNGGTLVANPGDLAFAHFYNINNDWLTEFIQYFISWLNKRGVNASLDNNDILVDDYKVCATCITRYGRIDYTTVFINVNSNLNHIKLICKKPMVKVPRGLSNYGITTEEIEQMFLEFCEKNNHV